MVIDEAERQALDAFLGEHWPAFEESAKPYLSEAEMEGLAEKIRAE